MIIIEGMIVVEVLEVIVVGIRIMEGMIAEADNVERCHSRNRDHKRV